MGATVRKLWKLVTRASAQSQQTRPRLRGAFLMAAADLAWRIAAGGSARARKRSLLEVPYRSSAAVVSPSGTPGSNLPWLLPSIGRALLFLCQALPHLCHFQEGGGLLLPAGEGLCDPLALLKVPVLICSSRHPQRTR